MTVAIILDRVPLGRFEAAQIWGYAGVFPHLISPFFVIHSATWDDSEFRNFRTVEERGDTRRSSSSK
jgi:hypothetical protein